MATKRVRNQNFSADEKEMITDFVQENAFILESKTAEPSIFKKRRKLWDDLAEKMRAAGFNRSPKRLRDTYNRMKQGAKTKISKFKKEQRKTVGGTVPNSDELPSEVDWMIYNIASADFVEDTSTFDSDGIQVSLIVR